MTIQLKSKPGITGATVKSIPKDWDATWFRNFINNMLKGADVRNAVGTNGITVSGTIASPYATISFSGAGAGTVTSVSAGASGDIVIGGTPTVAPTVDLSAGAQAGLALAATALQPVAGLSGSYTNTNLTLNASGQITAVSNGSGGTTVSSPYPPFEEYAAELTWEDQQIPLLGTVWPGGPMMVNGPFTLNGVMTFPGPNSTIQATTAAAVLQLTTNATGAIQLGVNNAQNLVVNSNGQTQLNHATSGTAQLLITPGSNSVPAIITQIGNSSANANMIWQSGSAVTMMELYGDGGLTVGPNTLADKGSGTVNVSGGYYLNGASILPASPYPPFEEYAAELTWEDQQIPLLGTVWPGGPLVVNGMATVSAPGETIKVVGDTAFLNFRNTALSSVLQLGTVEAYTGAGSNATDAAVGAIGVLNLYAAGSTTAGISLSSTGIAAPKSPVASATTTVLTGLANFKSSLSTSANATLTADASLTVTCNETGWYDVEAYLVFFEATSGAGGFQFDFNAGGGTIANASFAVNGFSTAAFSNAAITSISTATSVATVSTSSTAPSWARVKGTIQVTVAGTFGIRWAQASILAIDPTTLTAGSKIVLTKIG